MENLVSVLFLFFPMIRVLDRSPVCDVSILHFCEYSVEQPRSAEQADMPTMQRGEWPAPNISLLGEQDAAGLTVCRRVWQQVFHFVEWNSNMRERHWPGVGNLISHSRCL